MTSPAPASPTNTSRRTEIVEILRTENITKSYDGRIIIRGINIHLEKGELVSLLGVSGSGKTTLFQIISGLTMPDSGTVYLDGTDITGEPGHVSYMLQKDLLLAHKKVIDNVTLPLIIRGMKKQEARKQAEPFFSNSGWKGRSRCTLPSSPAGCVSVQHCFEPTWVPMGSPSSMNPFPHWT